MAGPRKPNKRAKGEGSIYRVTRGRRKYWQGAVEAGHYPNGKRKHLTVTRRTKREVIEALTALKRRVGAGVTGPDATIAELLDEYLGVRAPRVSASTMKAYRQRARDWVVPHVGRVRVRKLSTTDVRRMMSALEASGVSAQSANLSKGLLGSALRWGMGEQPPRVERNVCDSVEGAKLGAKLDDGLSPEEAHKVLAAARGDRLYALVYISITLGLRQGEALGLHWSDVDLEAGELRIDQSKTKAGQRSLPLVASTLETLREHKRRQAAEKLAAGARWRDGDLVFRKANGSPISSRTVLAWWHDLCATAGIPRRRWHSLRHSAAGRMLSAGVPMELVSVILGHSGIAITADVYARWSKDAKRRELGRYLDAENS
jgi:integrase